MSLFDKGTQDIVYSVEEGWVARLLKGFIWFAVISAVFALYAWSQFHGLKDPSAMEQAQLARNVSTGAGFVTKCIRPVDLWYLGKNAGPAADFPDIRNAPLYPAVLATGFKIARPSFKVEGGTALFAPETRVIVPLGILFSMGTGLMIFLLGRKLFNAQVGLAATILYFVSNAVLAESISGSFVPMLAFLATAAAYAAVCAAMLREEEASLPKWGAPFVGAAILCALAFLTHHAAAVLAPALGICASGGRERGRMVSLMVFLAIFLLAIAPWLVRNKVVTGGILGLQPYTALHNTVLFEDDAFDRETAPALDNVKVSKALQAKLVAGLARVWENDLRLLGSGLAVCFFLVSFFHRHEDERTNRFRWLMALSLVMAIVLVALGGSESGRVLGMFLPVVILYGMAFLFVVVNYAEYFQAAWDKVLAGVLIVLTALPAIFTVMGPPSGRPYPPYYPPLVDHVCRMTAPGETICTDIPWATAWYGDRPSLLLPKSPEGVVKLEKSWTDFGGIYLTTETGNRPYTRDLLSGKYSPWLSVLNREIPAGFPMTNAIALPPDTRDQLFIFNEKKDKGTAEPARTEKAKGD